MHFICFRPLYERLLRVPGVEVFLSGGLRSKATGTWCYDEQAMYAAFGLPAGRVLPVERIREEDFDVLFSAHSSLILPKSVRTKIQIFHGLSFRNMAVRQKNMSCDHYFIVGPYMRQQFQKLGFFTEDDPRATPVGFMKTDCLIDGSLDRVRLRTGFGFDDSRPVLLYAPTGARHNSLETMGEAVIDRLMTTDRYDLLIKLHDHPKSTDIDWYDRLARFEGAHCRVVREPDVTRPLFVADLLITDASSVSSEFALLDRPMVFLDVPELIAAAQASDESQIDLETWGRKGGLVVRTPDEVGDIVGSSLDNPGAHREVRQGMAMNLFYNPGRATDAAMRWLEEHLGTAGASRTVGGSDHRDPPA